MRCSGQDTPPCPGISRSGRAPGHCVDGPVAATRHGELVPVGLELGVGVVVSVGVVVAPVVGVGVGVAVPGDGDVLVEGVADGVAAVAPSGPVVVPADGDGDGDADTDGLAVEVGGADGIAPGSSALMIASSCFW